MVLLKISKQILLMGNAFNIVRKYLRWRITQHENLPALGNNEKEACQKDQDEEELGAEKARTAGGSTFPTGCRAGVICSCGIAFLVLLINLSVFTWAFTKFEVRKGTGILYRGGCSNAKFTNAVIQVVINVLSTVILGASNYCMQCLSAPTRKEVDRAHAKAHTLEIGVPALLNLRWISPYRAAVWVILGLNALPIHFLCNSVVILTSQANRYKVLAGPTNFLSPEFNTTSFYGAGDHTAHVVSDALRIRKRMQVGEFGKLSPTECREAFLQQYVTKWGDVVLIQNESLSADEAALGTSEGNGNTTNVNQSPRIWDYKALINTTRTFLTYDGTSLHDPDSQSSTRRYIRYSWPGMYSSPLWPAHLQSAHNSSYLVYYQPSENASLIRTFPVEGDPRNYPSCFWQCLTDATFETKGYCNRTTYENAMRNSLVWKPFGSKVQYCLSEKIQDECSLIFNVGIGWAVVVCHLVKACCMCLTFFWVRRPGLMTVGDALESFIGRPDPHTVGFCTLSARRIEKLCSKKRVAHAWPNSSTAYLLVEAMAIQRPWKPKITRWWLSVGLVRLHCCMLLFLALLLAAGSLGPIQVKDGQVLIGIGTIPGKNSVSTELSLVGAALLANTPQIISSYIFLGFNCILTSMFAAHELMEFSKRRKPLRVTSPRGQQRSTYWLQLPYRFSIPLLMVSGAISWLTSQILFVVRVQIRDSSGVKNPDDFILTCGYSPGAIVITILVGLVLGLAVLIIGLKKFPDTMPLAGTNSAAIAALCHVLPKDKDCALKPLGWGVVSDDADHEHCSFSAEPVEPLVAGEVYH